MERGVFSQRLPRVSLLNLSFSRVASADERLTGFSPRSRLRANRIFYFASRACVSICPLECLKNHSPQNFTKFSVHVNCGHGSVVLYDDNAIRLCASDVMFAPGPYGTWLTGRILKVNHQGVAPVGAKSDVYDCLVGRRAATV